MLISGAGSAGPAPAFWLTRYGCRVVVVELAAGKWFAAADSITLPAYPN
ncbi:MAG: hypothetical protein ABWY45_21100 [Mycobacterium sp.]